MVDTCSPSAAPGIEDQTIALAAWMRTAMRGATPAISSAAALQVAQFPPSQVVELAMRHRLTPWICAALQPHRLGMPVALMSALDGAATYQVSRTLSHYVELLALLEWANSQAIEIVVLKGAAIAQEWYPEAKLRPYNDIDILIAEADVSTVATHLCEIGFVEDVHDDAGVVHHEHGEFQRIFTHPVTGQIVEVHVNHLQIGLRPVGMRDIWERSTARVFHRSRARGLEMHDLFVHLAVHLHRHGFDRLIWFKDLDLIARGGRIDWAVVGRLADEQGCRESLATALDLLVQTLGTPLPPAAIQLIEQRSRFSRWLFNRVWRPADVLALAPRRRWRMRRAVQFAPETGVIRGGLAALFFTGRNHDKLRVMFARITHHSS